jgi:uncharacterized protein (TIGR02145 family)
MTIRHYAYAAGIATSLVLFAACGDDVTEVTNVSENASLDQVKKFKELPKCEENIEGTLVYVKDSAKVFGCTSDGWVRFNGLDGADGKNGTSGDDGVSCTAKQNKKKTGYDIVCDGKTVATIENGSDGKKGSDGDDGVSCTAKQNKKKTGIDVTCGDSTVTIPYGIDGADGAGCTFEEGENGAVKVTCGEGDDANSLTLFKAACGSNSFDPETQFCYETPDKEFIVGNRCKYRVPEMGRSEVSDDEPVKEDFYDEVYNPNNFFCDGNDTLRVKCLVRLDNDVHIQVDYDYENEYCDRNTNKVRALAYCVKGDKKSPKYKPEYEYCYTTKFAKGIQVDTMPQCGSDYRYFNPRTDYCTLKSSGKSELHDTKICTKSGKVKDSLDIDVRYTGEDDFEGRGSICDTRDYQVYKYTTIKGASRDYIWMAQNLNYSDTLMNRRTAKSDLRLDSTSFCYDNDPANCVKYGRLYTWSAAIDSVRLNSGKNPVVCGYGAEDCDLPEVVKGICPDGWHLPSYGEAAVLARDDKLIEGFMVNDYDSYMAGVDPEDLEWDIAGGHIGNDSTGFAGLPSGIAHFVEDEGKWTWIYEYNRKHLAYWTTKEQDSKQATIEHLWYRNRTPGFNYMDKYYAISVRCVRDAAE